MSFPSSNEKVNICIKVNNGEIDYGFNALGSVD